MAFQPALRVFSIPIFYFSLNMVDAASIRACAFFRHVTNVTDAKPAFETVFGRRIAQLFICFRLGGKYDALVGWLDSLLVGQFVGWTVFWLVGWLIVNR